MRGNMGTGGRTGWCLSLPRECGRSRPPESGVAPLASASNPLATPVRVTAKERWDLSSLGRYSF